MHEYQREFIGFALECGALRFGEFELKSGRISPYFFNTGLFNTGRRIAGLGRFYAEAIRASGMQYDVLYGPAYKGIPLVAATAAALWQIARADIPYAFNRKEAKDHGEGGVTVGAPIAGHVLIVDDVISAGTSVRESIEIIRDAGATPAGVAISLDRQERGQGATSAVDEVRQAFGLEVVSIVSLGTLITYLEASQAEALHPIRAYREAYGVA